MKNPEEARAVGEEIKEEMLKHLYSKSKIGPLPDVSNIDENLKESVVQLLKFVHDEILPNHDQTKLILYHEGRSRRSFEFELQRLWDRVTELYLRDAPKNLPPNLEEILEKPKNKTVRDRFLRLLAQQLKTTILSTLDAYDEPGDDLYLYICERLNTERVDEAVEAIANARRTLLEHDYSYYAMFGLLIQAHKAHQVGDTATAYTYLMDLNHLIGMNEAARYTRMYSQKVHQKQEAKMNSEKSRYEKNNAKIRAAELFYALRPLDESGHRKPWKSANVACEEIWDAMVDEAVERGDEKPKISVRTVLKVARDLMRLEKAGYSLDLRVEVEEYSPEGGNNAGSGS